MSIARSCTFFTLIFTFPENYYTIYGDKSLEYIEIAGRTDGNWIIWNITEEVRRKIAASRRARDEKTLLRSFIVILIAVLIIGFFPVSASAVNELVLTKLGHSKNGYRHHLDPALRSVTLTAPNRTSGNTIDLNTGLIVERLRLSFRDHEFEAGSVATIGDPGTPGPAVTMTVKYYKGSIRPHFIQPPTASALSGRQ